MASRDGIVIYDLHAKGRTGCKRWWARIRDRRLNRYTRSQTFDTKEDALRWAIEQRSLVDKGLVQPGRPTLAALGAEWAAEMERRGACPRHIRRARLLLTQLAEARIDDVFSPHFATDVAHWVRNLKAITRNKDGKIRRLSTDLSNASRNRYLAFVKAILHYAMKTGRLAVDPLRAVSPLKEIRIVKPVFSVAELRRLLDRESEPFWLPFALLIYTGMRTREALHLRWEWIDFDSEIVYLRQHPDLPLKTNSERIVPLQRELAEILRPRRLTEGWIIADPDMRDMSHKTGYERFHKFLDDGGVPIHGRSPHSTRHTWVAMMLATGASPMDVKAWAGHRQWSTTERYASERGSYRSTVSGWPAGQLCLRTVPSTRTGSTASVNLFVPDESILFTFDKPTLSVQAICTRGAMSHSEARHLMIVTSTLRQNSAGSDAGRP